MRGWYFLKTTVAWVFINGYYDLLSVYLLNRASPARARLGESPPPERAGGAFFRSRPLVVPSGVKLEDAVVHPHDDAVLHEAHQENREQRVPHADEPEPPPEARATNAATSGVFAMLAPAANTMRPDAKMSPSDTHTSA